MVISSLCHFLAMESIAFIHIRIKMILWVRICYLIAGDNLIWWWDCLISYNEMQLYHLCRSTPCPRTRQTCGTGITPPTPVISRQPALPSEPHPPLHAGNDGGGSRVKAPSLMSFKVQPRSSCEVAQLSLSYYRICWRADASSLHV